MSTVKHHDRWTKLLTHNNLLYSHTLKVCQFQYLQSPLDWYQSYWDNVETLEIATAWQSRDGPLSLQGQCHRPHGVKADHGTFRTAPKVFFASEDWEVPCPTFPVSNEFSPMLGSYRSAYFVLLRWLHSSPGLPEDFVWGFFVSVLLDIYKHKQ